MNRSFQKQKNNEGLFYAGTNKSLLEFRVRSESSEIKGLKISKKDRPDDTNKEIFLSLEAFAVGRKAFFIYNP